MIPPCQAINLSDERRCGAVAGGREQLFCLFHARQCYGLYKGYKRRNLEYDRLVNNPPPLLQNIALHEIDLTSVDDERELKELHDHLFRRYSLLDRVIRARRIHHSRFYSLELDYGHENYINQLSAQRQPLLRALERVIRRTAEVLYHKQKWFKWVRKLEDDEEQERDAEKKKVKQEAALFKRHTKEVEARTKELRAKEDEARQLEFLDKAWQERKLDMINNLDETTADDAWDPIEDTIEDERGNYIELLRHFLWLQVANDEAKRAGNTSEKTAAPSDQGSKNGEVANGDEKAAEPSEDTSTASKSKNAKKKARQKANAKATKSTDPIEAATQARPGEVHVESLDEMRARLKAGEQYHGRMYTMTPNVTEGFQRGGNRAPPLNDEEIDQMVGQITEIKQLLFCRLLLAHAALLPAGLRANSVEEFLANEEVNNTELRDLCLKMEQPGLQELRDACADLKREEAEEEEANDGEKLAGPISKLKLLPRGLKIAIPKTFQTKREKAIKANREKIMPDDAGSYVDFGDNNDQDQHQIRKIRVKICGRYIYNYPSEKAMSRGGWLQFSVLAKDCSALDAVKLCRNWEEFYELVTLIQYDYFPGGGWIPFVGGQVVGQLQKLGFFTYHYVKDAYERSMSHQTSRGEGPRQHGAVEIRNYICGQMKRNDPVSRRFIQYILLQSSKMVMLVRDVSTGNVLAKPPDEELWLERTKFGTGRLVRADWDVITEVGTKFFEQTDQVRKWSLGFKDYYDIIIWDLPAGEQFPVLYNNVQTSLFKALRFQDGPDIYRPAEHILRSITIDSETKRGRDLKPGEEGHSLWDWLCSPGSKHLLLNDDGPHQAMPDEWKYNETDRLEDEVLFPWENTGQSTTSFGKHSNGKRLLAENETVIASQRQTLYELEHEGPDFNRFVHDLDTDEELSDIEEHHNKFHITGGSDEEDGNESGEWSDDDGDDDWEDDLDDPDPMADRSSAFSAMATAFLDWQKGFISEHTNSAKEQVATNRQMKKLKEQQKRREKDQMAQDFELFIDREKAAAFKESWHRADLEPHAQENWSEYKNLMSTLDKWLKHRNKDAGSADEIFELMSYGYRLLTAMDVSTRSHHKVVRDMISACEFVALFMDEKIPTIFFASEPGKPFKDTMILNQPSRAKNIPDRRTPQSNRTRPRDHFKEWDTRKRELKSKYVMQAFNPEWNLTIRPIIAHLYRENVLAPSYQDGSSGPAISLIEPSRPGKPDLFFDWRHQTSTVRLPPHLEDPKNVTPLLSQAQKYAKSHPTALVSVLKIWSSPHFWPLMLGPDNRDATSFTDGLYRNWEWKFIPKDMPASDFSIHTQNNLRLDPYRLFLMNQEQKGCKVVLLRDAFLIMTPDRDLCRSMTTAICWMINTRPWRLEVDPWKSWVGVDFPFLEELDEKWWE